MNNNRRITLMRPSQVFDSFMDEFFNTPSIFSGNTSTQINMYETNSHVHLEVKVPGFTKDDLDINFEGDVLTISGNTKAENKQEDKDKKYYIEEMRSESFSRMIRMPVSVEPDKTEARIENGILQITVPKKADTKPKKIEISAK